MIKASHRSIYIYVRTSFRIARIRHIYPSVWWQEMQLPDSHPRGDDYEMLLPKVVDSTEKVQLADGVHSELQYNDGSICLILL